MSVIPFVIRGKNKTIVSSREEYEDAGGLEGGVVFIQDIDDKQLGEGTCNASYDLRVGDEYRDHRDSGKTELGTNDEISLRPGAAVIIETAEEVQFPKARFGHIVPKVSLLQKGLSNTSSKIDPGYNGKLLITVFNLGKQNEVLKKGAKFCTLYVLEVKTGVIPYRGSSKRIIGEQKKNWIREAKDFIESNNALLLFLFALVPGIVTAFEWLTAIGKWIATKW